MLGGKISYEIHVFEDPESRKASHYVFVSLKRHMLHLATP
jgi:hypothetical protein